MQLEQEFDSGAEIIDDWYVVEGDYFTNCSFAYINGSQCDTQFVNEKKLLIHENDLESLDVITVSQKSNSTVLSTTEPYTYFNVQDLLEDSSDDVTDKAID